MATFSLKLEGAKELERKLLSLEPKIGRKIIRQALRKAAKPILKKAKSLVPTKTGALKKSLKIKALKKRKNSYGIMVGTSEGWFQGDEFYGGMVEFGTDNMAAQPYVRPAFDAEKDTASRIIKRELRNGIKRLNTGAK